MKVLIVGIDALEYDLVEEWNLRHLQQKEYGKVRIPTLPGLEEPTTPQVWASFLTGRTQEKQFEYTSPVMRLLIKLKKIFQLKIGLFTFLSKFANHSTRFPQLKEKSFLDQTNSEYYNIPYYDFSKYFKDEIAPQALRFWEGKSGYLELKEFLVKMFEKEREGSSNRIKKSNSRLFFCYFFSLDLLQHHFHKDRKLIKEYYEKFDKTVKELKKCAKPDFCLIVSDHGAKDGGHSNHGFYSVDKILDLGAPDITDFYDVIMDELNLPTREETEKIKARLHKLGYF